MTRTQLLDRLFQISAVIVCGGCLVAGAGLLAACTQTWDPCGLAAAVIFLPLPIVLGVAQYFALTRTHRRPAWLAARLLGVCVVIACPALLVAIVMLIGEGDGWIAVAGCAALLLFCGGAAWLNERRGDHVLRQGDSAKQFSLRDVAVAVTALAVILGLTRRFGAELAPQYAENVPRSKAPSLGLPPNAREVTYLQSGFRGPRNFEFTIDEADFRAWFKDSRFAAGAPLQEITTPQVVLRCQNPRDPAANPDVTVANGLFYFRRQGRFVNSATFDRTSKRAYIYSSSN